MKNNRIKLSEAINDADYVDYGFWLLFERFQVDALQPEFFDVNPDGVKTGPWCFYAICPKDLGWTDNVIYDPDPKETDFDRDFITYSQCEAFSAVMTSIFAADLRQDEVRLGEDYDGPASDEQVALDQIRNRLDVVAADLLKFGPYDGAIRKTLEIRLEFIKLLLTNRHDVLPSLGLDTGPEPEPE